MRTTIIAAILGLLVATTADACIVKVTIKGTGLNEDNFVEFKIESDQSHGEKATKHIVDDGEKSFEWSEKDLGTSNQNIWYWWDTIHGSAHLTVRVNDVVVFDGDCLKNNKRETNVKESCPNPKVYKVEGTPRLNEYTGTNYYVVTRFFF